MIYSLLELGFTHDQCQKSKFEIPSLYRSQDEDADNRTERTHGDVEGRKKYSHVDLIHMIGGMDAERGIVTAGGRGYYLMVR